MPKPPMQEPADTSVVLDSSYDAWQRIGDRWHAIDRSWSLEFSELENTWGPLRVVYVGPGPEPPDTAIVVDRDNIAWQRHGGVWYSSSWTAKPDLSGAKTWVELYERQPLRPVWAPSH